MDESGKPIGDALREIIERCRAIGESPTYQERAEILRAEDEAWTRSQRLHAWQQVGIPEALFPFVEEGHPTPALNATASFLARAFSAPRSEPSLTRILILAGPPGTGKSVALAWAVSRVGGRFAEAADLAQLSSWDVQALGELQRARLLALDDLGAEPLDEKGWGQAKFFDLVNYRLQTGRPTILATNLAPQDFVERYADERLRDRLRAHSEIVLAAGPSLRGRS